MELHIVHSNTQRRIHGSFSILCKREYLLEISRQIDFYLHSNDFNGYDRVEIHPLNSEVPAKSWDE